ncbi:hypothetical protein [Rhizobium giardinii]|jgi:hypothetical protein|uniref:hypothetical protein n=1 Tax=Rhizobium giardinii TaxID=56731 RepID=UPI0013AE955C
MLIDELGDTPATARAFLSRLMAWGVPPTTTEGRAIARPFLFEAPHIYFYLAILLNLSRRRAL